MPADIVVHLAEVPGKGVGCRHSIEGRHMVRKILFGAVVSLAAGLALPAAAATARDRDPELLAHAGKWQVDYDQEACHLLGRFGAGGDEVVARFTRYRPDDAFDLALYGRRLQGLATVTNVALTFGPGGVTTRREAMIGTADEKPMLLLTGLRLDGRPAGQGDGAAITPAQEAAVAEAIVQLPRKPAFRLGFGSLGAPLAALRACQTDLVRHWGFDPEVQARLSRPVTPIGDPAGWLSSNVYPTPKGDEAENVPDKALVQFRLDVDPEGLVSGCHVLYRTQPDTVADATCRDMTARARFRPALDAAGKPVRSFYVGKADWQAS